ncbi:MAG: SufD family Fe-S cluster assembly protein, partial [Chloroflexi bacterium]|nr:SufD family Fe-S cluster assembly protein [Chloroflexota bacterium]
LGRLLHSAVTEVHLGTGAVIKLLAFQDWSPNVYSFTTQRIDMGRDSSVEMLNVALGGHLTKGATDVVLSGSGARARVLGLCFGDGEQQFDHSTLQDHQSPDTTSDLLYKGALKERARSVFTGLVRVHKVAQRTDAFLTRRDLLLGAESKADSLPILEIEANDVRCSHAAAVGQVDEEQTFYLTSRGLEPGDAEKLIVMGFFEDLLNRAGFAPLREQIKRSIERKLERGSAPASPVSS